MISNATSQAAAASANDIRDIKPPVAIPSGLGMGLVDTGRTGHRGRWHFRLALVAKAKSKHAG